jgi:hypothetical protein
VWELRARLRFRLSLPAWRRLNALEAAGFALRCEEAGLWNQPDDRREKQCRAYVHEVLVNCVRPLAIATSYN